MIPMALAKKILAEVAPDDLEREKGNARDLGITFDQYVQRRMEALLLAPRSHVYLAQLRARRLSSTPLRRCAERDPSAEEEPCQEAT